MQVLKTATLIKLRHFEDALDGDFSNLVLLTEVSSTFLVKLSVACDAFLLLLPHPYLHTLWISIAWQPFA